MRLRSSSFSVASADNSCWGAAAADFLLILFVGEANVGGVGGFSRNMTMARTYSAENSRRVKRQSLKMWLRATSPLSVGETNSVCSTNPEAPPTTDMIEPSIIATGLYFESEIMHYTSAVLNQLEAISALAFIMSGCAMP